MRATMLVLLLGLFAWGTQSQATYVKFDPHAIVIVKKYADPADDTPFHFEGDLGEFTLQDPSDHYRFDFVPAGSYDIVETPTSGWNLDKVTYWSLLNNTMFTPIENGVNLTIKSWDLVKVKFHNVAAVPVPGAVWLLGSGLLALVGIRRRSSHLKGATA